MGVILGVYASVRHPARTIFRKVGTDALDDPGSTSR